MRVWPIRAFGHWSLQLQATCETKCCVTRPGGWEEQQTPWFGRSPQTNGDSGPRGPGQPSRPGLCKNGYEQPWPLVISASQALPLAGLGLEQKEGAPGPPVSTQHLRKCPHITVDSLPQGQNNREDKRLVQGLKSRGRKGWTSSCAEEFHEPHRCVQGPPHQEGKGTTVLACVGQGTVGPLLSHTGPQDPWLLLYV